MNQLGALADPTRRRIVELLADRDQNAGQLASRFAISQPAISRHLRLLRESGLVTVRPAGQQRVYSLDPAPLVELDEWLARNRALWSRRLDALEAEVRRGQAGRGVESGEDRGPEMAKEPRLSKNPRLSRTRRRQHDR
jgi:DNA-binding transcriptional ArsR family regulator